MPGLNMAIPPPDARELLPSLLACLSTANTANNAPPGLLPLLSPILRQRVQLLASDEWLSLLCWDREVGQKLPQVVERLHIEPHPASGEIEVEEPDEILYRRSDPETLHSRLILGELDLLPTYLWCTGGDNGNRWLLAELRGLEDAEDGTEWFSSMVEANEAGFRRKMAKLSNNIPSQPQIQAVEESAQQEEEDDSYWAAYDRTPGQTPQQKRSPAPMSGRTQIGPTQTELQYFARYASEVQPALDAHDPDEDQPAPGESTLNGSTLNYDCSLPSQADPEPTTTSPPQQSFSTFPRHEQIQHSPSPPLTHPLPRPSSAASSTSVERLERRAESFSQAEVAIKQHISTDIKSLFRLAKATGMDREEFERIVQRELEILPLLEQEQEGSLGGSL